MTTVVGIENISVSFGGIKALTDVSFGIAKDKITALIGPNGAGKTTVFNCITGFYRTTSGEIRLSTRAGKKVDRSGVFVSELLGRQFSIADFVSPKSFLKKLRYKTAGGSHLVARAGVARTFQNIRLFKEMTVLENLLVARHGRVSRNPLAAVLGLKSFKEREIKAVDDVFKILGVVGIEDTANLLAGDLPYGLQRRVEIARALATEPEVLCLDEPAAGLNPEETKNLSDLICRLRDDHGLTVLVIEHDMGMVMGMSDHIVVLDSGKVIAEGAPLEVKEDPNVIAAYLGTEA